ncbi:hypothetical protein AFL22_06660 [Pantoea sp. CFSAN033090]|nr:hypothetical protein AFL22_06660 [Pantoea sp. CFSAN033090]
MTSVSGLKVSVQILCKAVQLKTNQQDQSKNSVLLFGSWRVCFMHGVNVVNPQFSIIVNFRF